MFSTSLDPYGLPRAMEKVRRLERVGKEEDEDMIRIGYLESCESLERMERTS